MTQESSEPLFAGEAPAHYDRCLGPYFFAGYAADLAARAGRLKPGSVVEIAAGTGISSRALRDALGAETRLLVTDVSPPMLDIARAKFAEDEPVEFLLADAADLPLEDDAYDLAVCQFGVMFYPDKVAAYRETARVLHPGGVFLFNAWDSMDANPAVRAVDEVARELFPEDPPEFLDIPFHYHRPDEVRADLAAAGFDGVEIETVPLSARVEDWSELARGLVFGNPLAEEIRARGDRDPEEVVGLVEARLRETLGREPVDLPLQALVVMSRAPAKPRGFLRRLFGG